MPVMNFHRNLSFCLLFFSLIDYTFQVSLRSNVIDSGADPYTPGGIMEERFILDKQNVVLDKRTGLMWQQGASTDRIVWKDGFEYIEKLNAQSFAGYSDWRYPTQDELASLILPEENQISGLFIDPVFEKQRNCWSSTQREGHGHQACYADFYYGDMYVVEENYANLFVRAVRTRNGD